MAVLRIIALAVAVSLFVEAQYTTYDEPVEHLMCDPANSNITNIQCFCVNDRDHREIVKSAECHLTKNNITPHDAGWNLFEELKNVTKLSLSNTRGFTLTYIPTKAIEITNKLVKLTVKYGNIETIKSFDFANLTALDEIILSDNQIKILKANSFAHHNQLTRIVLDTNNIIEINRDVFVDLPSLQKLFLTNNKITTIHDKAFVHLTNLQELEINRNSLFSLNSETFSGLINLEKLDLSSNNLEVIGDNTFMPLNNLKILNLEGNKIQMLDEKAFNGLKNLYALSLAHNELTNIENVEVFSALRSLTQLNLKANQLRQLKAEVLEPILGNFYGPSSTLDIEDNNFPCECHLDWFMSLINRTQNSFLRLSMENLKCSPSDKLRELWGQNTDSGKNSQVFEDEDTDVRNTEYEYYDEAQLNGKLFYIDVRDLANCTNQSHTHTKDKIPITTAKDTTPNQEISPTTSAVPPRIMKSTTAQTIQTASLNKADERTQKTEKNDVITTSPLAEVSADPSDQKDNLYVLDMASDEGRPEKSVAHRSVQDRDIPDYTESNAHVHLSCYFTIIVTFCFRLII